MDDANQSGIRRLRWTACVLAVIFLVTLYRLQPPSPRPDTALADQFSAARAMEILGRLLPDAKPHPIASPANNDLRARILKELSQLGYSPEIETAFACDDYGACGTAHNIVARLHAAEDAPPVLLSAHYDSVPSSPGASDGGAGVAAVLEIARALKSTPPRHSVLILVDDGEESGLLGARAFVDSSPWAAGIRAAVNIDARGTSGPSLLFETGSANQWALRLYASRVSRPATSSIFYTAYKQLPNSTDFTIFKSAGYQGLNFAFVGGVSAYHTPLDNLAAVNLATLQHQGDNALSSVLALANAPDLSNPPRADSVFFDVLEHWVVNFTALSALKMAFLFGLVLLLQVALLFKLARVTRASVLWGLCGWLFIVIATGIAGYLLLILIRLTGAIPVNWVAYPLPLEISFWTLALAILVNGSVYFVQRAGFWGFWSGIWIASTAISFLLVWRAIGISYVFVLPSAIAALSALPSMIAREHAPRAPAFAQFAALLPAIAAFAIAAGPVILLYDGLGIRALPFIAIVVALLLMPLAPLCGDLRNVTQRGVPFPKLLIALTALSAFVSVIVPPYSTKSPVRVNIHYWEDADSGNSQWIVHPASGRLPDTMRFAADFHSIDRGPFPWDHGAAFLSSAPNLKLAAPTFTILESVERSGRQAYRALLRSERSAPVAMALFPPDANVQTVRVNDQPVPQQDGTVSRYFDSWKIYRCVTMPAEGVEISFTLASGKPVEVEVVDATYDFPAAGNFLQHSRPPAATPSQDGDVTLVSRRVQFLP